MIKIFRGSNYPFVVAKLMYKYVVVVSCIYKNCVRSRQHDLLGQSRQMLSVFVWLVGWLFFYLLFPHIFIVGLMLGF